MLTDRAFRDVCSQFPTGVTVVTATDREGSTRGMTANAFMSVSLNPRLVLISIAERARMREILDRSEAFAVSMLADDQRDLSLYFAGQHVALDELPFREVAPGPPVIEDALAWLSCRMVNRLPAGDHVLYVGEAVDAWNGGHREGRRPLVFFQTAYVPVVPEHAIPIDWAAEYLAFAGLP